MGLVDIFCQYQRRIGRVIHACFELTGRTEMIYDDVLTAFRLIGIKIEDVIHFLKNSYNTLAFDNSFVQPLHSPSFHRKKLIDSSFCDRGEMPPEQIPEFLPVLPD